jgi:hypothetical protein
LAGLPLAIVLGFTTVAIGFNIQHDGGHSAEQDINYAQTI